MPETASTAPTLNLIRDAMAWARAHGHPVRIGVSHHGVMCVSSHARERWQRDPREGAVSPVGAAILQQQPPTLEVARAASLALGFAADSGIPFCEGLTDGMEKVQPPDPWLNSKARVMYCQGYLTGTELRAILLAPRRHLASVPKEVR